LEAAEQEHGHGEQDVADIGGEVDAAKEEDNARNASEQTRKPNHVIHQASSSHASA